VCSSAPRLDRRTIELVVRLDDPSVPIAEVYRRSRIPAADLDLPRPSYESFRVLVHAARRERTRLKANRQALIRAALYLDGREALDRIEHGSHLPK
jgi:hypothetical protein